MPSLSLSLSAPRIILSGITVGEPTGGVGTLAEAVRLLSRLPDWNRRRLLFDSRLDWNQTLEIKGGAELKDCSVCFVESDAQQPGASQGLLEYCPPWEDEELGRKHQHSFRITLNVTPETFAILSQQVRGGDTLKLTVDTSFESPLGFGWAPDGSMKIWDVEVDDGVVQLVGYQLVVQLGKDDVSGVTSSSATDEAELTGELRKLTDVLTAVREAFETVVDRFARTVPVLLGLVVGATILLGSC